MQCLSQVVLLIDGHVCKKLELLINALNWLYTKVSLRCWEHGFYSSIVSNFVIFPMLLCIVNGKNVKNPQSACKENFMKSLET